MTATMNHRQEALLNGMFTALQERFPALVRTEAVQHSPDDPNHFGMLVSAPLSMEEENEALDYIGELEADILDQYGYRLSLLLVPEVHLNA